VSLIPFFLLSLSSPSDPTLTAPDPSPAELPMVPAPAPPFWNHGPGTSGGGSSTASGETMRAGRWSLELRSDWTEFEHIGVAEAEARAIAHGGFDAIEHSWTNSVALSYGLTDDLQLGATLGYYAGKNFIDAEADGLGGAESATADPKGMTDTW